ncbi:hypothetical protein, partial [Dickeya dianthicola]|uniref:hypothetical protein n=1 Tax=Dickeya dianthicola TaxID=204039 RepID=UPI001F2208D6
TTLTLTDAPDYAPNNLWIKTDAKRPLWKKRTIHPGNEIKLNRYLTIIYGSQWTITDTKKATRRWLDF